MDKKVWVLVAEGSEEMETVITVDVLRRAGLQVTLISTTDSSLVKCSRNVTVHADTLLSDINLDPDTIKLVDALVLPGGLKGAQSFKQSAQVQSLILAFSQHQKWTCAICAAPIALTTSGLADLFTNSTFTSHPSVRDQLRQPDAKFEIKVSDERVVVDRDRRVVTSQGPGTTFEFALEIVRQLVGEDMRKEIMGPMVLPKCID